MTAHILDLNDAGLRIAQGNRVVVQSPGFAVALPKSLLFGDDAIRQFKRNPRQAHNQFWNRLSADALAARSAGATSHADLVFRHLQAMAKTANTQAGDELIIAAPATTTTEQLALLLGIVEEVGLTVTGLVDSAVAATTDVAMVDRFTYVDITLHRLAVTRLEGGQDVSRIDATDVAEISLAGLLDGWAGVISDRFVRETRFDPLAVADTEQQIYDQVYAWMSSGAAPGHLAVEILHKGAALRVELPVDALVDKAALRYRFAERAIGNQPVVLSHRAASLPGFAKHLGQWVGRIEHVPADSVFESIGRHHAIIRSDPAALRLVTRLPSHRPRSHAATTASRLPTHVVWHGLGVPIAQGLRLSREVFADLPRNFVDGAAGIVQTPDAVRLSVTPGTSAALDGVPIRDGAGLFINTKLEVGGASFQLIRVVDEA